MQQVHSAEKQMMQSASRINMELMGQVKQDLHLAAVDAKLISAPFVDKMLLNFQKYDPVTKREMTKAYTIRTTNFPYYLYIAGRRPRGRFFVESEEEKKKKKDEKKKKKGKKKALG